MRSRLWHLLRGHLNLALKCGSVLFLFLVSVLVVACGASNTTQVPGTPAVTVTINLNQTFASPTPPLAEYSCGAWVTQSTPAYSPNAVVAVYAKFVHNVDGNPQGMAGASALAIVHWPNGSTTNYPESTTSDGLAVFPVKMDGSALNHVVLIEVEFTSTDGHKCSVVNDQEAFFTAIAVTPSPAPSPSPKVSPTSTPPFWWLTPTATGGPGGGGPGGGGQTPTPGKGGH